MRGVKHRLRNPQFRWRGEGQVRAFPGMTRGDIFELITHGTPDGTRVFGHDHTEMNPAEALCKKMDKVVVKKKDGHTVITIRTPR